MAAESGHGVLEAGGRPNFTDLVVTTQPHRDQDGSPQRDDHDVDEPRHVSYVRGLYGGQRVGATWGSFGVSRVATGKAADF